MRIIKEEKIEEGASRAIYLLWKAQDNSLVESSVLYIHERPIQWVICLPSSLGCQMGCSICAIPKKMNPRNLSFSELNKMFSLSLELIDTSGQFQVSFMGQGEPFLNIGNIFQFCSLACSQYHNLMIGFSTVGIANGIRELSFKDWASKVKLQISLHAWPPSKRIKIIPAEKKYPIKHSIDESILFAKKVGKKVFLSYAVFQDFNDSESDAFKIARLALSGSFCIKVCEFNPVPCCKYKPSYDENIIKFCKILQSEGIDYYRFRSIGTSIGVGCGQTRMERIDFSDPQSQFPSKIKISF